MTANMNTVEMLTFALSERRSIASDPTCSVTIEVTADGAIHSIRLSDAGRQLPAEQLTETIKQLHATATAKAQHAVKDVVAGFGDDSAALSPVVADEGVDLAGRPHATGTSPESAGISAENRIVHPPLSSAPMRPPTAAYSPPSAAASPSVRQRSADVVNYDDEDEYYRNFSITQQDDYRSRSNRPEGR
ncbi:hypothetical protein ACIA8C_27085 [Nocardia sp. NPDC051321]|uniref:hypothetical protein n=1 Tax=Nocardia sp. NPDC051321 TaxID=3364323 RepID=UPI0037917B40